eukprot:1123420-Rhodomonas_salina.1
MSGVRALWMWVSAARSRRVQLRRWWSRAVSEWSRLCPISSSVVTCVSDLVVGDETCVLREEQQQCNPVRCAQDLMAVKDEKKKE